VQNGKDYHWGRLDGSRLIAESRLTECVEDAGNRQTALLEYSSKGAAADVCLPFALSNIFLLAGVPTGSTFAKLERTSSPPTPAAVTWIIQP
jgi:hypothetical protein